jgi:hypothetical protein
LGSEAGVTGFKPFASPYPQTLLVSSAECQGVHSKKFGFEHGIPSLVRRISRAANYYADSTSFSKRYSDCPPSNSTSSSVRPRFFVTETSVPSLGNSTPVFGDRIIVVRFSFTPVSINHLDRAFPHSTHKRASFMPKRVLEEMFRPPTF